MFDWPGNLGNAFSYAGNEGINSHDPTGQFTLLELAFVVGLESSMRIQEVGIKMFIADMVLLAITAVFTLYQGVAFIFSAGIGSFRKKWQSDRMLRWLEIYRSDFSKVLDYDVSFDKSGRNSRSPKYLMDIKPGDVIFQGGHVSIVITTYYSMIKRRDVVLTAEALPADDFWVYLGGLRDSPAEYAEIDFRNSKYGPIEYIIRPNYPHPPSVEEVAEAAAIRAPGNYLNWFYFAGGKANANCSTYVARILDELGARKMGSIDDEFNVGLSTLQDDLSWQKERLSLRPLYEE